MMQSSAVISSSNILRRSTRFSRLCSFIAPIHRYYLSQDGEIISRGSARFGFVCFCDECDISGILGQDVSVGRRIGYIRGSESYSIRLLHTSDDSYVLLKGKCGSEIFKQIR